MKMIFYSHANETHFHKWGHAHGLAFFLKWGFFEHRNGLIDLFLSFAYSVLRPTHTNGFAPGACSRGTLWEQSSSMCTNDFMGILHPREQNFHPAKCSTIFNRLNILEQAPGALMERTWKHSLVCTDTCKRSLEHAPGAKPLVCIGLYWPWRGKWGA